MERHCIVCEKILQDENHDSKSGAHVGMVGDGLFFRSNGNYGSTVFDPASCDEFIEVVICDECVRSKLPFVRHVVLETPRAKIFRDGPFQPGE